MIWTQKLSFPVKAKTTFYVITATGLTLVAANRFENPTVPLPDTARALLHGVVRSSCAVSTIAFNLADYKLSLLGLPEDSEEYRRMLSEVHLRSAKRIQKLCEINKGFYAKAGQFVASMQQVPKEYSSTLSSLQDQAVPCHFKAIKEVLIRNLGQDLSNIFLSLDEQPIAAASIAQVHRAMLNGHREVAIKIQYPGLEQQMKIDLKTMSFLSNFVSWIFPDYRFGWLVSEFTMVISAELDFIQEARNAERTAKNFEKNKLVRVPHIYWVGSLGSPLQWCSLCYVSLTFIFGWSCSIIKLTTCQELTTSQVLTMQFCGGCKVDDIGFLKERGIRPVEVAKVLMEVFAEMIFVHGFVHGDPHPGNILVSPEGPRGFSLVLLDHGIYQKLDEGFRHDYCQLWKAMILLDSYMILLLGEKFGVGKYSRYFPVIFTGRTIGSQSALGKGMSGEEKKNLKHELKSLKMEDISSFMESLPPDFLLVLRTDGILRSIVHKLGASQKDRILAYAKYALLGLYLKRNPKSDVTTIHALSQLKAAWSYLQLRIILQILELLPWMEKVKLYVYTAYRRIVSSLALA